MGVKFIKYLRNNNLIQKFNPRQRNHDTLLIDGTNIFCFFSNMGLNSFEEVQNFIIQFLPKELIYIAMDGEQPDQKVIIKSQNGENHQSKSFDQEEEKRNMDTFKNFGQRIGIPLVYNGRGNKGEAEHKIIQYIKQKKSNDEFDVNKKHYVVSNDNDLIFLLLQFYYEDISVITVNKKHCTNQFVYEIVSIIEVRHHIVKKIVSMNWKIAIDMKKLMSDIILISFMLGNDYVQRFEEINGVDNAFDIIINAYNQLNTSIISVRYVYLSDSIKCNGPLLKQFVRNLNGQIKMVKKLRLCQKRKKMQKLDERFNSYQKEAANNYVTSLRWTLSYYLDGGVPTWTYKYIDIRLITLDQLSKIL